LQKVFRISPTRQMDEHSADQAAASERQPDLYPQAGLGIARRDAAVVQEHGSLSNGESQSDAASACSIPVLFHSMEWAEDGL